MGLIELLVVLAIVGVIVWLLTTYVPMPSPIRTVIVVIAALACLLYALRAVL